MKKKTPLIKASRKQRVKIMLLSGQKLTVKQLDDILQTNNSPEIIRQLRKEMPIVMNWVTSSRGTRYGVYSYLPPNKISKIDSRAYMTNF